ncbi:MAG TPA: hypothetical protein VM427_06270 [Patescibacteria group bacterium]|nr:hypothetical protein [Patescibacteria group bacterium]
MTRVAVLILHAPAGPGDGPLASAFAAVRRANAERQAIGFRAAGADQVTIDDDALGAGGFAGRLRAVAADLRDDGGLIVLGSGSSPLATAADRSTFVAVARGPAGHAVVNNRYSADIVAVGGAAAALAGLPDLASDNGLPRWLAESAGVVVDDLRRRWRLQVDLDSPLDAVLISARPADVPDSATVRSALARVGAVSREPRAELIVAGRASASGLAWLERTMASRTRALIEERGFRTRVTGQRPVASTLGLLLACEGPAALGRILAGLGEAALVDSRVLLAQQFGSDETAWPAAEDRFASDLLIADRIADPWLRALTIAARDAPIPIVLGGHSLVGPGLRLALRAGRRWT